LLKQVSRLGPVFVAFDNVLHLKDVVLKADLLQIILLSR